MKRRAEHLETGAGGHSMLKYLKDDVDWDAVHAETQARLMRSQGSFAFSSNGHTAQLNQEPMPFNQRRQQQQQQQPSTQLNSLHSYFQPQQPSVNTQPLHSKPQIHPQNQHHPTQLQPEQRLPEPQFVTFVIGLLAWNVANFAERARKFSVGDAWLLDTPGMMEFV
ncbi:hypothetical protein CcCBS67573_g03684 [Chytriomyces confervae]|uniref:Uncharacterized protein n=1 Tax=Chytriomyces confervae TaxID=246404 RepID=A0A507FFA2_9FUNG|nr:hypothetical protein CcCBS67573_g03684 [Chytriomyces confervae]